jgi:hypothetical protein
MLSIERRKGRKSFSIFGFWLRINKREEMKRERASAACCCN